MSYTPPYTITEKASKLASEIDVLLKDLNNISFEPVLKLRKLNNYNTTDAKNLTQNQLEEQRASELEKYTEIKNSLNVYKNISSIDPYSVKDLQKVHKSLMQNLLPDAGNFRTREADVCREGKVIFSAPPARMVENNVNDLFNWLKNSKENLLIKACVFHFEISFIHPFSDGNGRINRLWHTALLNKYNKNLKNFPIENIASEFQNEYYKYIDMDSNNYEATNFIEFMLDKLKTQISRQIEKSSEEELVK